MGANLAPENNGGVREVAHVPLPTPFGSFEARAFECASGYVYLALVAGDIAGDEPVLTRLHSECLTGDALGSLRCDCGIQLRASLRAIASEHRGVLLYATGHEGRGIGLVNKLRAYAEQDNGFDTVDANLHLGLPVDGRDYGEAAQVLKALGIGRATLITNNPRKVEALRKAGVTVTEVRPLPTASHIRNLSYLNTKRERLGHANPLGASLEEIPAAPIDVTELIGPIRISSDRPFIILKYAQSLDGRIATSTGDSKWISGEAERAISHALRARCDGIMVGVGTVLADDPELTVRLVPGASPIRIVLDSKLRTPRNARVLDDQATTMILTTPDAPDVAAGELRRRGAAIHRLPRAREGVDLKAALAELRGLGVQTLLVEGGARLITTLLRQGTVDRLIVALAPKILGSGTEGVGDLKIDQVVDGLTLKNRVVHVARDDVLIAADVEPRNGASAPEAQTNRRIDSIPVR